MKTIGLIGGMSWESTTLYYKAINETVRERLGGLNSGQILLYSVQFGEMKALYNRDQEAFTKELIGIAKNLENAGAEMVLICTNTMHKFADIVQENLSIPLVHICDAVAERLKTNGYTKALLLGTKSTMTDGFYTKRMAENGVEVIGASDEDANLMDKIVFEELCQGRVLEDSKKEMLRIIDEYMANGGEAVILGCTELSMIVTPDDTSAKLFDSAEIHATMATDLALKD